MDIEKNNMAHQEKANNRQKKGLMMSFYKFSTSKSLRKPQSKSDPIPSITNKPASKLHNQHRVDHRRTELQTPVVHDIASPRKSRDFEVAGKGGMGAAASEGRKSVSHVETNVASVAAFLSVKVLAADMPAFMQAHAFRCARSTYDSLEKFSSKHMAFNLKKEFDKVYGPAWHCIVGSSFGSFVTHSTGCFLYFSMEKLYILVFRTKVRRALD